MQSRRTFLAGGVGAAIGALALLQWRTPAVAKPATVFPVMRDEAQWRQVLTAQQFDVLRRSGTERPYSSVLNDEHRAGRFSCAACQQQLFSSKSKFDSGTGWPSFWQALPNATGASNDSSLGMLRDAIHCARCGGHLGHVFDDGPKPTGLRYCMNGVAMTFTAGQA